MSTVPVPPRYRRVIRLLFVSLRALVMAGLALWTVLAAYFSNLPTEALRACAAGGCALLFAAILWRVRPWRLARLVFLAPFLAVVIWFLWTPPSKNRDWAPDVALLPYAEIEGSRVTIYNIRNCDYLTEADYTVRHYDKTFDLEKLRSVDLYLVYWGSTLIAHTMMSFGLEDGSYICFSIETRKEKGETYSATRGFFRQYELTYVIGDERDLVRLRTNYRGEQVYLYRLNVDPMVARAVLLDYLREVNRLKDRPEWYNALTSNCTTNIRGHTRPYAQNARFDWRILFNGRVDEMAYERKSLNQSLPFNELKARSLVNDRAKAADKDPTFSARIRDGLPGPATSASPASAAAPLR